MLSNKQGLHKGLHHLGGCGVCTCCVTGWRYIPPPPNLMYIPPLCVFYHWKFDHRQILWHCSLTEHLHVFRCMGGGGGGGGRGKRERWRECCHHHKWNVYTAFRVCCLNVMFQTFTSNWAISNNPICSVPKPSGHGTRPTYIRRPSSPPLSGGSERRT